MTATDYDHAAPRLKYGCFHSSVTPNEWQDFSDKNILKAEREKNAAINLQSIVDGVLIQTYNDLKKQFDIVNLAFEKRIEETEKAKTKLETHLTKVEKTNIVACKKLLNLSILYSAIPSKIVVA